MIVKKVHINNLKLGMYVSHLDRPWVQTPFLFQGFFLNKHLQIDDVRKHCGHVYIDIERGEPADVYMQDDADDKTEVDLIKVEKVLPQAKKKYKRVAESLTNMMQGIKQGKHLDIAKIKADTLDMIEDVLKIEDAYLLLTKLKDKDNYTYLHSLSSSILGVKFGKELCLSGQELRDLALGIMLFDVGKMMVPDSLINKQGKLTDTEYSLLKLHVNYSIKQVETLDNVSQSIIDTIASHHERFDGSGYPKGIKAKEIPLFARIAGIVDTYDAITSERLYCKARSHDDAIKELYRQANTGFPEGLIEQFVQCLGIYPTGSLVELSTGEVGVVIQQSKIRRLKPRVMIILNKDKVSNDYFPIIDLLTADKDEDGQPYEIKKSIKPEDYGIDPVKYYL